MSRTIKAQRALALERRACERLIRKELGALKRLAVLEPAAIAEKAKSFLEEHVAYVERTLCVSSAAAANYVNLRTLEIENAIAIQDGFKSFLEELEKDGIEDAELACRRHEIARYESDAPAAVMVV